MDEELQGSLVFCFPAFIFTRLEKEFNKVH
ncbi:hypothetical protein OIU77_026401 [Salix suchowensis]|uniref:Uncharacterized protein n=1 Tax=Salix suchowensis TaxID=1278906 RepID=A0ABQ9BNG7_9ROSI|nr:hypothetical protein OIU77_026401 [Salix suchowensis]